MKKQLLIITVFFLSLVSTQAQRTLTYIESSNGIGFPAMEGGRTELEFADIDADGHIDLLSIGDHGSPYINTQEHGIMVWFGDGSGNWEVFQNGNFGYGGIAVGDVNNDGFLDVGYAMHHNYSATDFGDQLIEVALGDGTGINWTPWDDGLATNGESWGMFGTDFADIDNDGYLDLGSVSFGSGSGVHIYRNMQNGSWEQTFGFLDGNSSMIFDFGDINNDGYIDFAVTQQYGTVYFGGGGGSFVLMDLNLPSSGNMGRWGTSLGDIDNDGGKDLAYVNNNGGIEVWEWNEWDELWQDFSGTLPEAGVYEATQLY
ncbi:MAG: VCBS repeat-containing protein, partial [Bacteroidales bacterium]|nr:VCBS repeat-containing protein [Bacteroidales bacterium]